MNKKILSLLVLLFCIQLIVAQESDNEYAEDDEIEAFEGLKEEKKKIDLSRFRVGLDLGSGLQFGGQGVFAMNVSATIGYQIIRDRLEIGPGLIYQHLSQAKVYSENNIGGQAYIRGYIWQGLYAQIDGYLVNFNAKDISRNVKASFTYGNGFAGVGYAFNHTQAPFYFNISVKTNLVTDSNYPRRTLIPSFGLQFRL